MSRLSRTLLLALALGAAAPAAARQPAPAPPSGAERKDLKDALERVGDLLDAWDVVGARAALGELEKRLPADAEPLLYYQGRVAFEEGRYPEAVDLLSRAGLEDKPGSYLRLAKDTHQLTKNHVRAESAHFVLLHPPGKDAVLVPYALETLEAIHAALGEDLGWRPPGGKIRVEVINNARELAKVSTLTLQQIQTTGTIAICKFNKLMVTSPKAVARGYDWQDTLAHEYIHLVVSQLSRNTVPIWLHEGTAKYLESRWRGEAGLALTPSTKALLGRRVKADTLIPFEKMHPSIAMLPTAEDAATAFAEVFYAVDFIHQQKGVGALRQVFAALEKGKSDRQAVEAAMGVPFAQFERAWLAHVRKQEFPKELLPQEKVVLREDKGAGTKEPAQKKKGREISFGDFAEVTEVDARKFAHLGELMRERNRVRAASEELRKAHRLVGDKYESVSNKLALTLLELRKLDEAEKVLRGSLRVHPGSPATNVHLGRILLHRRDWPRAKAAYLEALASDPFDPEIHLALTRIGGEVKDGGLQERARKASVVLTGLEPAQVDRVAQALLADAKQLGDMQLPGTQSGTQAKPEDAKEAPRPPAPGK